MLKTTFKRETRYSEVKKQKTKYNWFISRLKCNKQYYRIAFRGQNVPSKVRLRYLEVVKHQERLNDIKKGTVHLSNLQNTIQDKADVFRGKIERN